MYKIKTKLSNNEIVNINIERPELIYGATAIVSNVLDTNLKGINPLTKEEIPIINVEESVDRFLIPLHNEKDYKIALKKDIPMIQAVAPYFLGDNEETPKKEIKTQLRYSVVAVIKNEETNEYLCEDAKGRSCRSFVMGGVEDGETPSQAALREIYEETGYKDITITKVSNIKVINHFYAGYKGVNRYAYLSIVFGKLNTDSNARIKKEEEAKHEVCWIKKANLKSFVNNKLNIYATNLIDADDVYTGEGIMITNDENNGLDNIEVRNKIISRYCSE